MPHVVIAGASGLVGTSAVSEFSRHGWRVTALSRSHPHPEPAFPFDHVSTDITDRVATAQALASLPSVSHLVYCASFEKPGLVAGWSDPAQMNTNRSMLANVLEPLAAAGGLEHVSLMQGTKAYGVHLHQIPLPARENAPRDDHPNFYWLQEDLLTGTADRCGFDWTILRPVGIVGPSWGTSYSTPPVIGAYAALCRELDQPFGFPGGNIFAARQVVDARIVASALRWCAEAPTARGQHFNLTNGEVFSWPELWPMFARELGVDAGEAVPLSMTKFFADHGRTWRLIAERFGLRLSELHQVVGRSDHYADYTFGFGVKRAGPAALVTDIKIHQAGFTGVENTEETFRWAFRTLIQQRVLPGPAQSSDPEIRRSHRHRPTDRRLRLAAGRRSVRGVRRDVPRRSVER
jgi:nucleoside-diphosphate-sugar epimerase